jgi:triosephosphate isomerase
MKALLVANWKMNLSLAKATILAGALRDFVNSSRMLTKDKKLAVAPSAVMMGDVRQALIGSGIRLAGQNCSANEAGAYTGEVSAESLLEYGCDYVILGHSERRKYHMETSEEVSKKSEAALKNKLTPIICIGESAEDRKNGFVIERITKELNLSLPNVLYDATSIVIAYEPIWAIGSGRVPSIEEIREIMELIAHIARRKFSFRLGEVTILYGGSVTPENSRDILKIPGVGGLLIGGASIIYEQLVQIIELAFKEDAALT